MTHSQKWLEIEIAFETEPGDRTDWQNHLTSSGLCFAADELIAGDLYEFFPIEPMKTANWFWGYWRPIRRHPRHVREHDLLRATFAGFMAALSPKEFNEMIGGK